MAKKVYTVHRNQIAILDDLLKLGFNTIMLEADSKLKFNNFDLREPIVNIVYHHDAENTFDLIKTDPTDVMQLRIIGQDGGEVEVFSPYS